MNIEIRKEYGRLLNGSCKDRIEAYDHLINSGFALIPVADKTDASNMDEFYDSAKMLFQMVVLKCKSIQPLLQGFEYSNPVGGRSFNNTTDPFSITAIVRCQFEAYAWFNNLYLNHTGDQRDVLYRLWVISGLKYRQNYKVTNDENRKKKESEYLQIQRLNSEIKSNTAYLSCDEKSKEKIDQAIKKKQFQFCFNPDGSIINISWKEMFLRVGIQQSSFDQIYSYLSLGTHPSHVSIFQFRELYRNGIHKISTIHLMDVSKFIMAFFIRDYCVLFPAVRFDFENHPIINQLIINSLNNMMRGENYRLNNINESV